MELCLETFKMLARRGWEDAAHGVDGMSTMAPPSSPPTPPACCIHKNGSNSRWRNAAESLDRRRNEQGQRRWRRDAVRSNGKWQEIDSKTNQAGIAANRRVKNRASKQWREEHFAGTLNDHNVPHRCHYIRAKERKTSRLELIMAPLVVFLCKVINI